KYVGEKPFDPVTFEIYPDEKGSASATLYEDDGVSPAYQRGVFRRTKVEVKRDAAGYRASLDAPEGSYNPGPRKFRFVIKSAAVSKALTVADDGRARTIEIK